MLHQPGSVVQISTALGRRASVIVDRHQTSLVLSYAMSTRKAKRAAILTVANRQRKDNIAFIQSRRAELRRKKIKTAFKAVDSEEADTTVLSSRAAQSSSVQGDLSRAYRAVKVQPDAQELAIFNISGHTNVYIGDKDPFTISTALEQCRPAVRGVTNRDFAFLRFNYISHKIPLRAKTLGLPSTASRWRKLHKSLFPLQHLQIL